MSASAASSSILPKSGIQRTVGIRPRSDCMAEASATFPSRSIRLAAAFPSGRATQREDRKKTISAAPSSTAFCTISSVLSPLGSAAYTAAATDAQPKGIL